MKTPSGLPSPQRLNIIVNVSFNGCHINGLGLSNRCDERLTLEAQYRTVGKKATIRETFQFSIAQSFKGVFTRHSKVIETPDIESISLTFLSSFFCGHIREVFVYFDYCPAEIKDYATFECTSADSTSFGKCVKNSVFVNTNKSNNNSYTGGPTRHCNITAITKDSGSCQCQKGMTGLNSTNCEGEYFFMNTLKLEYSAGQSFFPIAPLNLFRSKKSQQN